MAEFRMQLGANLDVVTPDELDDAVTGLQGHIDRKFQSLSKGHFTWRTISAAAVVTFTNGGTYQLVMNPASPAIGKVWSLRRVTITGGDDHTSIASLVAAVYAGDSYNFALTQCIVPGQILPYFQTFGTSAVPIKDSERLFVNFTAAGSLPFQEIQASMTVIEWNECDIENQYA